MGKSGASQVILDQPHDTERLAGVVALALPRNCDGWLILLQGDLGSGKSTFARALLGALGHTGTVPSPTYTLVEPYEIARGTIYHVDLYRVSDSSELDFLGWDELRNGFLLVEWPERVPSLFAEADVVIHLHYHGEGRSAQLDGVTERGKKLVSVTCENY